mgnify:CR=1 FL=1
MARYSCSTKIRRIIWCEKVIFEREIFSCAADPSILEMGTKVEIGGIVYTVEDTGESATGNVIDIYFDTHEEAVRFGRQRKEVYLVQ